MAIRIRPKQTISASDEFGLLQGQCVSEDVGPEGGVNCEISHGLKRRTKHSL